MIRLFLTIVIIFLIIRWITRLFSPGFSKNHQGNYSQEQTAEGETILQTKHQKKKKASKNKGEYVDFEEIE